MPLRVQVLVPLPNKSNTFGCWTFLIIGVGLERALRKHAGGMFLARGKVRDSQNESGTDVDCESP